MAGQAAAARFPVLRPPPGHVAILEPGAGFLAVESAVVTMAALARRHGAEIRVGEVATAVCEHALGVEVTTPSGVYAADELVITAGAWSARWLPSLAPRLAVHRVLLHWFRASPEWRVETGVPCFGFDLEPGFSYGVPEVSTRGVKVGLHVPGERVERPEDLRREVAPPEAESVRAFVEACLPGVDPEPVAHAACMYTMTPDEHFVLGRAGRTTFAAGFSGHGFKFAPVIGEALADLAQVGRTVLPIGFLAPRWPA
jgi:glycine/D-amino acid oxidase-like deaminating enzyme